MSHTNPSPSEDFDFADISREEFREYQLEGGDTYRIENPVALYVKDSGSHRVLAQREDGRLESHYIDPDGKRPVKWVVGPGEPFFLGWGPASADGTPAPEVQPGLEEENSSSQQSPQTERPVRQVAGDRSQDYPLDANGETQTYSRGTYSISEGEQIMMDAGLEMNEGGLRDALKILEDMPSEHTVSISGDEEFDLTICTEHGCIEQSCGAEELVKDLHEYLDQLGERAVIRATPDGFRVEAIVHQ